MVQYLEKSSINVMKYRYPVCVATCIGPHISECTKPKILVALLAPFLGNLSLCCLPARHDWHMLSCFSSKGLIPCDVLWICLSLY